MKKFFSVLILLTFFTPLAGARQSTPDSQSVSQIIEKVGGHMLNMQKPEGDYIYEYWPFFDEESSDDNLVRQIGTIYTMGILYKITGEPAYAEAAKRTAEYWLERSKSQYQSGRVMRYFQNENGAKLGSAALFYVGISYLQAEGDWWQTHEKKINEVMNFIRWMKKTEGGFAKRYIKNMSIAERDSSANLGFYDGEALLALTKWDAIENSEASRAFVFSVYDDLMETYKISSGDGLHLWLMTASWELYDKYEDDSFYKFARKKHQRYIRRTQLPYRKMVNSCASLEGINAYLNLEKRAGKNLEPALKTKIDTEMERLTALQVTEDSRYRVFLNKRADQTQAHPTGWGGFLTSFERPAQRIDYQQHCVSAFYYYQKLLDTK